MMGSLPPDQMAEVLRWLAVLALGTALARPLALRLVPGGGGWIPARLIAWAAIGWVPWVLAALKLMPFGAGAMTGLLALALARLALGPAPRDLRGQVLAEAAFLALFWLGLAARLKGADLTGLEKFTDMGFLSAAMRAGTMPPQDAWFAGFGVNYYYVGQAMAGAWGNLAGLPPDHTYQLAMATLFALTGLAAFRIAHDLAAPWGRRLAQVLGAIAVPLTLWGGNFHSFLYTALRGWMPATQPGFYYPDSTRFIGFDPPTPDKGFTEFLAYAFAVGDLHAHLVATVPFFLGVLLLIAMLRRGLAGQPPDPAHAAALGWILGLCLAMNSWDVAILGLLALIAAALLIARPGLPARLRLDGIAAAMFTALAVAALTAAPFLATFRPFAAGIEPAPAATPLWQLLVLYGHVLPALGLLLLLARHRAGGPQPILPAWLFVAGLLLVALPETVIVRDIYGLDFARANTMFKLSFRGQSLLIFAALAALAPALRRGRWWLAGAFAALLPLLSTLAYLPHVFAPPSHIASLDGLDFLGDERALVEAAARLPLAQDEAIIEAAGDAFSAYGRVSALTGQPAVIGWPGHEWLWRGAAEAAFGRADLVHIFYTSADLAARCSLIRRFGLRYVILGTLERARYPALDEAGLRALGPTVHSGPGGDILQIAAETCQG